MKELFHFIFFLWQLSWPAVVWQSPKLIMFYSLELGACLHWFSIQSLNFPRFQPYGWDTRRSKRTGLFQLSWMSFLLLFFFLPISWLACNWDDFKGSCAFMLPTDVSPYSLIWSLQIKGWLSKFEPLCSALNCVSSWVFAQCLLTKSKEWAVCFK